MDKYLILNYDNTDEPLQCPRCHGNNLHQDMVHVFNRDEDAAITEYTVVAPSVIALTKNVRSTSANPSERRQGLAISFWCENCDTGGVGSPRVELTVVQHKGCTYLGWRKP